MARYDPSVIAENKKRDKRRAKIAKIGVNYEVDVQEKILVAKKQRNGRFRRQEKNQ
jgi:hypothetical protein